MSNIRTFSFEFQELPLVIVNDVEAGFINGIAIVEYSLDGEWCIESITLEGFGERDASGKRQWPQVDCPPAIAAIIDTRLNKEWFVRVCDAVREQLASDHEDAAEQRAEMRRDQRMGL